MEQAPQSVTLQFPYSAWDRIRASFVLSIQRPTSLVFLSILPLAGLALELLALSRGMPLENQPIFALVLCFLFPPAIIALTGYMAHSQNKANRDPFSYFFDNVGVHVKAAKYEYTHRWEMISRIRPFGGFLLLYFGPGCAHCIPLSALQDPAVLQPILALASSHGVRVDGV